MTPAAVLIGWVVCGVLAYGITFASFSREFPPRTRRDNRNRDHASCAAIMGLFGPFGLVVVFFLSSFAADGLRYRWRVDGDGL